MSYNVIYWQQINGAMDTEMWWNSPKWPWPKTKLPSCATSMNICNIYICLLYMYTVSMYLCIYVTYLCIYVSIYLCIYVSMSVCMYMNMCKGINISQKKKLILPPLDLFVTFSIGSCKGFFITGTLPYQKNCQGWWLHPPPKRQLRYGRFYRYIQSSPRVYTSCGRDSLVTPWSRHLGFIWLGTLW